MQLLSKQNFQGLKSVSNAAVRAGLANLRLASRMWLFDRFFAALKGRHQLPFSKEFKQGLLLNFHDAIMTRNFEKMLNFAIASYSVVTLQ